MRPRAIGEGAKTPTLCAAAATIMRNVTAEEVHRTIDKEVNAVIIDVLGPKSFAEEHVPRSISIPEKDPRFLDKVQEKVPDKTTPVVVYCAGPECEASLKAAQRLEEAGYRDVREWSSATREASGSSIRRTARKSSDDTRRKPTLSARSEPSKRTSTRDGGPRRYREKNRFAGSSKPTSESAKNAIW